MITRIAGPARGVVRLSSLQSIARPSAIALGKRPVLPPRCTYLVGAVGSSRQFSWTPWKTSSPEDQIPTDPVAAWSSTALPPPPATPDVVPSTETSSLSETISSLPSSQITNPELLPQSPAFSTTPTLEELITQSGKPLAEVLASPEAIHAPMAVSDLSLIGLQHGFLNFAGYMRDALTGMHSLTGLPWWATIALTTVSFRLCLFPLIVRMTRHNVRLSAVQPQMSALMQKMNEAKKSGDVQAQQVSVMTLQKLMKEHDVSPFAPILMPLVQMPFFLSAFYALRKMANLPVPQLKEGGFSWVTDLTMPDPYFILPITSVFFTNLVIRVGADGTQAMNNNAANMGHMRNFITVASIVAIPLIGKMPAAVLFYWTFTNLFSLLQATILSRPAMRKILRIPEAAPPAPLPPGVAPPKVPTYKDSFEAAKDFFKGRSEMFNEAKRRANEGVLAKEREKGARAGTGLMVEKVREKVVIPAEEAVSSVQGSPVLKAVAGSEQKPNWMEGAQEGRNSKEIAKDRRVAAARERRRK